jgi:hypothetical protein
VTKKFARGEGMRVRRTSRARELAWSYRRSVKERGPGGEVVCSGRHPRYHLDVIGHRPGSATPCSARATLRLCFGAIALLLSVAPAIAGTAGGVGLFL